MIKLPQLKFFHLAGFVALLVGGNFAQAESLANYSATLKQQFADVRFIQPDKLQSWTSDTGRKPPLLLDVRNPKEFAVSHLANAKLAEADPIAQLRRLKVSSETPIVVYCSVGYRSAILAQRLQKEGFTEVQNLEGSIFAWANEGRPLINSTGAVNGVHPFNQKWGRYLQRDLWRWNPEKPGP